MILPTIFFIFMAIVLFLAVNKISSNRAAKVRELELRKKSALDRYNYMINKRSELRNEIKDKERQLATLRNSQDGIRTISASDLNIEETDDNEKVSRYLIQEGKISLEQNEKVLQKMKIMQMDYLGSCLALGFIDLDTAKKAIKINKIVSKSAGLN